MINIKKLPKIYQNDFSKQINNNKNLYRMKYSEEKNTNDIGFDMTNEEVNRVINNIFNTTGYAFNIPVIIKTNTREIETSIIAKKNGYILTFDNDKIRIDDIISIKIKNP